MRERKIEKHLRTRVHRIGGLCIKMGQDGWPDRLVILPGGETVFVELKSTEGRVKPHQAARHETLNQFEQEVFVPHSIEEINKRFLIRG